MPLNESNVVERARRLLVCTIDAANFSDKMDVIFVAEMIEKISKFVEKFKDVSDCKSWGEGHRETHSPPKPPPAGCCDAASDKLMQQTNEFVTLNNELLCSCLLSCC